MINSGPNSTDFTLNLHTVPGLECASTSGNSTSEGESSKIECEIRDVWEQRSLGIFRNETLVVENVTSHDAAFFIIGTPRPQSSFLRNLEIQISDASLFSDVPILLASIMLIIFSVARSRQRFGKRQKKTIRGRLRR